MHMYVAFVTLSKEINCQHPLYCYVQKLYYTTSHIIRSPGNCLATQKLSSSFNIYYFDG